MLPDRLDRLLVSFAQSRPSGHTSGRDGVDVSAMLAEIDKLHPAAMSWGVDAEIAGRAKLQRHFERPYPPSVQTDRSLLESVPALAHLFIHHRDGHLREAALARLDGPARSAFEVAAIAYRMSDWVEPVRAAAEACAHRVFPVTDIDALAAATLVLAVRRPSRERGPMPGPLAELLGRADMAARFAAHVRQATKGPMCRLLMGHLHHDRLDPHLEDLTANARLPGVRARALQTLLDGHARLRSERRERKWIDKSLGRFCMAFRYTERAIDVPRDIRSLIETGLADRAVAVRRIARDGLIAHRAVACDPDRLRALANDPSGSIRERADFLLRGRAEDSGRETKKSAEGT